jgi:hypothetical protein
MRNKVEKLHLEIKAIETRLQELEVQMNSQNSTAQLVELQLELIESKKLRNDYLKRMIVRNRLGHNTIEDF